MRKKDPTNTTDLPAAQICGELYDVIVKLNAVADPHKKKSAGIGASDIERALAAAKAGSMNEKPPQGRLKTWPKKRDEGNGRYLHHQTRATKKAYWLPTGVTVNYRSKGGGLPQLVFEVNYVYKGKGRSKGFYVGTSGNYTEAYAIKVQDIAIDFRTHFEAASLANLPFNPDQWHKKHWDKLDVPASGVKPPVPYVVATSLDELIAQNEEEV